ncbi:MAG: nitrate reductase subunit beta [Bifidobacteriaceae bacterium]|nr:nitrate reductase subunit beta [Bifidobacteriaceae bacterium]
MTQLAMVLNLDKCIGCHVCSVTCKQTWTNRDGVEYAWFNNVESKPGVGYPVAWEDQNRWRGGWELGHDGRLRLRSGGRVRRLARIFANPQLPSLEDYYEPVTYDFDTLFTAPQGRNFPVAQPFSVLSGRPAAIKWGPNWEDGLAGGGLYANQDPNVLATGRQVRLELERAFMFHLPRLCEHCLNPGCVAACPSGAVYKRERDGIVLVDQDKCRGWRMCVTGCPYKKIYINYRSGKAEKCTFCFPRVEAGQPTVCSVTCVGRIRYIGVLLYDADAVTAAAAVTDPHRLLDAQRGVFLDPFDPAVTRAAEAAGITADWIDAARRSPVWALAMRHRVALPLHPEHRTLPMVWYIPPLSPVMDAASSWGGDRESADDVFHAVTRLRIPLDYLAQLFTAGDTAAVAGVLLKLAATRSHMRRRTLDGGVDEALLASVGASADELEDLYRRLGVAKAADRFVVPAAGEIQGAQLAASQSGCPLDGPGGPGMAEPARRPGSVGFPKPVGGSLKLRPKRPQP